MTSSILPARSAVLSEARSAESKGQDDKGWLGSNYRAVKYVLYYQSAPDVLSTAPLHIEAHRARWAQFAKAGTLLMVGPFADPTQGAMGIFTTREAAEEFAKGDPFVLNGVVSNWVVRDWMEALVPE